MPPTRPSGRVVALCVFAAAVASADAGGAVAWLQGGDVMRAEQNSTPRRHHHGGATSDELDDLRARIIPGSRAQVDMRDLADARARSPRAVSDADEVLLSLRCAAAGQVRRGLPRRPPGELAGRLRA